VSTKLDGAYLSRLCHVWIKVRNPASIAVRRARSGTGIARLCFATARKPPALMMA
jgi:hypothetical protein